MTLFYVMYSVSHEGHKLVVEYHSFYIIAGI